MLLNYDRIANVILQSRKSGMRCLHVPALLSDVTTPHKHRANQSFPDHSVLLDCVNNLDGLCDTTHISIGIEMNFTVL